MIFAPSKGGAMKTEILGLHHVTAIAADPQRNLNFYTEVLGLRLVKRTVNFDDPGTYHLYYGDEIGHPGTILTFFPWPGVRKGRRGVGQASVVSFAVPLSSLDYWIERFSRYGVSFEGLFTRFGEEILTFYDPDELRVELVACLPAGERSTYSHVPPEYAISRLHSVTLLEASYGAPVRFLTEALGFRLIQEESGRSRYEVGPGGPGAVIDVVGLPHARRGRIAAGTVHHVAWRAPDGEAQIRLRSKIAEALPDITPVIDRKYFESVYFREPGGVLFEIATDPPGFAVDEPLETLGEHLMLPPWLEYGRSRLEKKLPPLVLPKRHRAA
jgi:glyoxalase family protein